jgi:hypothetical protein
MTPTDTRLVDAFWAAATTQVFAGRLAPPTATLLCGHTEPAARSFPG